MATVFKALTSTRRRRQWNAPRVPPRRSRPARGHSLEHTAAPGHGPWFIILLILFQKCGDRRGDRSRRRQRYGLDLRPGNLPRLPVPSIPSASHRVTKSILSRPFTKTTIADLSCATSSPVSPVISKHPTSRSWPCHKPWPPHATIGFTHSLRPGCCAFQKGYRVVGKIIGKIKGIKRGAWGCRRAALPAGMSGTTPSHACAVRVVPW